VDIEKKYDREASMSIVKFFRLLRVRLVTQGLKATLYWLFNVFNRLILDQPIRSQCQITPQLFVGAQFHRRGWRVLHNWGITGVVNMRSEFNDLGLGVEIPAYLHLSTRDDDAPTLDSLRKGVDFIRNEIEKGGKVYIHCGAGVGRAPTMAAAYLVSAGMTPSRPGRPSAKNGSSSAQRASSANNWSASAAAQD
jgi:hypothetical protein